MTAQTEARRAIALTFSYDVLMAAMAMLVAVEARWRLFGDYATRPFPDHIPVLAACLFAISAGAAFLFLRVHRQVWRHMGWPDAARILQAVVLAALLFVPLMFLWNRLNGFPRLSLVICLPIWLSLLFSGRMLSLMRSTNKPFQIFARRRQNVPRALLVGDAHALAEALRQLERDPEGPPIRVLGLIETGGMAAGRVLRGATIHGGVEELGAKLDLFQARYDEYPWVATVGEGRSRRIMREVLAATSERGSAVMSLGAGRDGARLQPVQPEDLLGRRQRTRHMAPIENFISGTRLFVTGAGGTIGSELCLQCAALKPAHVTIFDGSEYNLYQIDLLLRSKFPDLEVETVLGDVRDSGRLLRTMREARPDIVVHAAALKHVPLMERNPCEAILTNAGGAANAANAAVACHVKHFVFISTDKAVDPSNVMGATKRLSEIAVSRISQGTDMATSIVRFGNVLGSSGSVVPLFERQIAEGGPVTVTDKAITRFFMTVSEAVYLILQAAAQQDTAGEAALYVLDMGQPVSILSLAESMIRMKGMVPGEDIRIQFTGLRPGDKMNEVLTYTHETLKETDIDGVHFVASGVQSGPGFELALESLLKCAAERDPARALYQLNALIANYAGQTDASEVASTG